MTINSYDNRRTYAGNSSTTAFSFPPPFTVNTDLVVQIQAADGSITTKVLGTDYTVSSPPYSSGGTVTMTVAPVTGATLIIYRDVPITQGVALSDGGPVPAATVNGAFDRITMWGQRLREMASSITSLVTTTTDGLMSHLDKAKLDGIAAGAQVNTVTSVAGRTGDVVVAKADVGLGNADNTSDANKPVSTAQAAAIALKLAIANNLSDLNNAGTALTNLGGSTVGKSVFTAANTSTALTALGAGATGASLFAAASAGAAQTILSLVPGTNVQAFSARLAEIAAIAWAQGDFLWFNGTNLVRLPAGTSGQVLATGGTGGSPSWLTVSGTGTVTSVAMSVPTGLSVSGSPITASGTFTVTWSGVIPVAQGSTGISSYTVGDILYADTTSSLAKLADVAGGNVLRSGGVGAAPSWGKVGLTTHVTGTLAPANGGIGSSSAGSAGYLLVSDGTNFNATAPATVAQYRAATANAQLDAATPWAAAAAPQLTDAATIAVDFSAGFNFYVTLGGNRTLGTPTNMKTGQTGSISIFQDGTGSRTLAYSSAWKFAGGVAPVLSTAASSWDKLYYVVEDAAASKIHASLVKGIA